MYELKVKGATNSFLGSNVIEGQYSEPRSVYLHKDCDITGLNNNHNLIANTKSLLIVLCCVFGLLFIVAALLLWQ